MEQFAAIIKLTEISNIDNFKLRLILSYYMIKANET